MPAPGEATAASSTATSDPRLLPWTAQHIAAGDAAAKVVFELLEPMISGDGPDAETDLPFVGLDACGSYLLRTALNADPGAVRSEALATSAPIVYPIDATLTMAPALCSVADVEGGKYLERREAALRKVEAALSERLRKGKKVASSDEHGPRAGGSARTTLVEVRHVALRRHPLLQDAKSAVVARFRLTPRDGPSDTDSDDDNAAAAATPATTGRPVFFDLTLHARPAKVTAKVTAAKAAAKHAWYSNLVQEDWYAPRHLEHLAKAIGANAELSRAITLAKLWARHVAVLDPPSASIPSANAPDAALALAGAGAQGISGFVLSMMLADVAGGAGGASTTDALLRQLWLRLSTLGLELEATETHCNLLHVAAAVSPSPEALLVRGAAATALAAKRGIQSIILTPQPTSVLERADSVIVISAADAGASLVAQAGQAAADAAPAAGSLPEYPAGRAVAAAITATVTRALNDRFAAVRVVPTADGSRVIVIGHFRSEAAARNRLLRGPPIEDREAVDAFDKMWGGDRTSTRQFGDGGVFRCLLWPSDTGMPPHAEMVDSRGATALVTGLVAHLVGRHHCSNAPVPVASKKLAAGLRDPLTLVNARSAGLELLDVLAEPHDSLGQTFVDAMPLAGIAARAVSDRVAQLVKQACGDSFPCVIKSVDAVTANARDTEVWAPLPSATLVDLSDPASRLKDVAALVERSYVNLRPTIDPIHAVVVIDDKKKIPDTLDAIAVMKGAIAAQLAKALTPLVSENVRILCAKASVDVVMDGYVVRLHIGHYREVSLLRALDHAPQADAIERRFFRSAQHARYIRGVVSSHPSASAAMRLLKRWVGAACMSEYVLPEALELIVAAVYENATGDAAEDAKDEAAASGRIPLSAPAAFLRALRLLSDAAFFARGPLILSRAANDVRTATVAYRKAASAHPEQGMFIAAPYVLDESPFTVNTPRAAMVERLAALAARSLRRLEAAVGELFGARADVTGPVAAAFAAVDCLSFDAVMPFTKKVRAVAGTTSRSIVLDPAALHAHVAVGHPWRATKEANLSNADLGRRLAALVERDLAGNAIRASRAAVREDALVFYDTYAPTAAGIVMLRKRRAALPDTWHATAGLAIAAVRAPAIETALAEDVPAALPEAAGPIKHMLEAAPGCFVAPHITKQPQQPKQQQQQKQQKQQQRPRDDAAKQEGSPRGKKQNRAETPAAKNKAESATPAPKSEETAAPSASPKNGDAAEATPASKKSQKGADTPAGDKPKPQTPKGKTPQGKTPAGKAAAAKAEATPASAGKKKPEAKGGKKQTPGKK